jgi:hypothetical protein
MWIAIIEAEELSRALAEAWIRQSDQDTCTADDSRAIDPFTSGSAERCDVPAYAATSSTTLTRTP